jgi:uncharacterized membrane protein
LPHCITTFDSLEPIVVREFVVILLGVAVGLFVASVQVLWLEATAESEKRVAQALWPLVVIRTLVAALHHNFLTAFVILLGVAVGLFVASVQFRLARSQGRIRKAPCTFVVRLCRTSQFSRRVVSQFLTAWNQWLSESCCHVVWRRRWIVCRQCSISSGSKPGPNQESAVHICCAPLSDIAIQSPRCITIFDSVEPMVVRELLSFCSALPLDCLSPVFNFVWLEARAESGLFCMAPCQAESSAYVSQVFSAISSQLK